MASARNSGTARPYCSLEVLVTGVELAEILSAEVFEAGCEGIEERESSDGIRLLIYAAETVEAPIREAIARIAPGAQIVAKTKIDDADWSEQWKAGLVAAEISSRLRVRPSFVASEIEPGQRELIIDPGQAFGTGGHPSTHLALEWIDALAGDFHRRDLRWRTLDVGTGTGVLSLAALAFGADQAFAFDLDPLAVEAARVNAEVNALERGFQLYLGPLDALNDQTFDVVAANLLRTELMPLLGTIALKVAPAGCLVLAGLLEEECEPVVEAAASVGLTRAGDRQMSDANGDVWSSLLMRR